MANDSADSEMRLAIVLAPRSVRYSRTAFQRHYEKYHAPLFYSFGKVAVARYGRNHIIRAIGVDPPFDTISEFGNLPAKRAELAAALASPAAKRLEEDVHDFLAERGNVFEVTEMLISGPPRGFEAGPVAKRMMLFKKAGGFSHPTFAAEIEDHARALAARLGPSALRIVLTLWKPDPAPPMDAMVAIWQADSAVVPDVIGVPQGFELRYSVDVESYFTAWRD